MKPFNSSPSPELSGSYVNEKGELVFFETYSAKAGRIVKAILQELPVSILILLSGMFLTQLYLLFGIFQTIHQPSTHSDITISLSIFITLSVFIGIAFKLGWSLVSEKEEALAVAAMLKKAKKFQKQ